MNLAVRLLGEAEMRIRLLLITTALCVLTDAKSLAVTYQVVDLGARWGRDNHARH